MQCFIRWVGFVKIAEVHDSEFCGFHGWQMAELQDWSQRGGYWAVRRVLLLKMVRPEGYV